MNSAPPPPPPPPPHGAQQQQSQGRSSNLPPGNYDIFVIPPHSSGSGFLYLPSLRVQRNSFIAGVACTLLCVAVWTVIEPVVKQWANTVIANGGTGVLILVLGVGVIGWAAGKTQNEGGHGGKPHGGGGTSQQAGGSHGNPGAEYTYATGADPPPQSHGGPPPYANGGPPPHANGGPPPHANTSSNPGASSNSKPQWQPPPKPSAGWEKAREEMRKKEEERKKREEADKKAKEAAEKAKWDQARQREREQREKEARERVAQERVKREKELRERIEREAREAREKQDREAKEARERKEREAKEKEDKERAERLRNVSEKQAPGGLSNYRKPTASSFVSGEDINSSYYRSARRPQKTSSQSSFVSDSSSYLSGTGSQSTARTTPPPSHRGPYVNKDPDKVSIKAVFLFSDTLPGKPLAQLRSGMGSVTDGLVLKMTTEGLFIDDDVRGVGQREWDVKAWTMKLVETGDLRSKHILRASIRDADNKKYVFIIDESEAWKVAVGLQRLRKGSQVRSLGVSQMSVSETTNLLRIAGF